MDLAACLLCVLSILLMMIGFMMHKTMIHGSKSRKREKPDPNINKKCFEVHAQMLGELIEAPVKTVRTLPADGWSVHAIMKRLEKMSRAEEELTEKIKFSGVLFDQTKDMIKANQEAGCRFLYSNLLFYKSSPSSMQMENELDSMVLRMMKGKDKCSALSTTGCSESSMLVLLAYKRYCLSAKKIVNPEVVLTEAAHPSFFKACESMDIRPIVVPLDKKTGKASVRDFLRRVSSNTICVVCSSPDRYYGQTDPIPELGAELLSRGVFLHVDSSYSGFILPFCEELEYGDIKPVDFRIEGLTSMSVDIDSSGCAAKGLSVLVFRNQEVQKAMYWAIINWCGYMYATPTFLGSRGTSNIAAGWASIMKNGEKGYRENAKLVLEGFRALIKELKAIEGVEIIGTPQLGIVAFRSPVVSVFRLGSFLEENGWYLEALGGTPTLQFIVTSVTASKLKQLSQLVKKGIEHLLKNGQSEFKMKARWELHSIIQKESQSNPERAAEYFRNLHHESHRIL